MRLSTNDILIFCSFIGMVGFSLVAIIDNYLGLPFYEPLQTSILLGIVLVMLVKK